MTFENLSKIIGGKLLNSPAVSAYEKIETKAHRIKHGDLLFSNDPISIEEAIKHGALGIVAENIQEISDNEIAWIEVENIHIALAKLLRFSLIQSDTTFTLFSPVQYALLQKLHASKKLIFLEASIEKNFHKIFYAQAGSHFISKDKTFLKQIIPDYNSVDKPSTMEIIRTHQTLFLSSFTYHDRHYEEIKLPALFLEDFNLVLHFSKENGIEIDINKLDFIPHFQPLFISNNLHIKSFGHSEHAFIVESDASQINRSLTYLASYATWAKIMIFLPHDSHLSLQTNHPIHYYSQLTEVKEIVVDDFNFILILANYNELSLLLKKSVEEKSPSLF